MAPTQHAREAVEAMCTALGISTVDLTDLHINPAGVHAEWMIRDEDGDLVVSGDSFVRRGEFIPMDHPDDDEHLIAIDVPTETGCCAHIDGVCFTSFDGVVIAPEAESDQRTDASCTCDHTVPDDHGECMIPAEAARLGSELLSEIQDLHDPARWPGDAGAVIEVTADDRAADVVNATLRAVAAYIGQPLGIDIEPPSVTADHIRAWKAKQ